MTNEPEECQPVSVTVDKVFEILHEALNYAIEQSGENAKAVAWDVNAHFVKEIGPYRIGANPHHSHKP